MLDILKAVPCSLRWLPNCQNTTTKSFCTRHWRRWQACIVLKILISNCQIIQKDKKKLLNFLQIFYIDVSSKFLAELSEAACTKAAKQTSSHFICKQMLAVINANQVNCVRAYTITIAIHFSSDLIHLTSFLSTCTNASDNDASNI